LVVVGPADDPLAREMHREALRTFAGRRVVQRVIDQPARPLPPAVRGMVGGGPRTAGYTCRAAACTVPATGITEWRAVLFSLGASVRLPAL